MTPYDLIRPHTPPPNPTVSPLTPLSPPHSRTELGGPRLQLTLWYHRDERILVAIVHGCR